MICDQSDIDSLVEALAATAEAADNAEAWPESSWTHLADGGVLRWAIPARYGGSELSAVELLRGNERLAGACLTTTFILSQRDAAVRRILANDELAAELLPRLAGGQSFATVGLSQLTTSRQFAPPSLTAKTSADRIVLDGLIPWVTGADRAHHLVAGAVMPDGQQILIVVPMATAGVHMNPPLPLAALAGSRTAEVECHNVVLDRRWLLAGPAPQVLSSGKGGAGGLETSCLAIGHAGAAIDDIEAEARNRPDLLPLAERLQTTRRNLREDLHTIAQQGATPDAAIALRARANALAIRATQAALTAAKGSGFVRPHPAQRRARQALFFLVWSCPRAAAEATLGYLGEGPTCS